MGITLIPVSNEFQVNQAPAQNNSQQGSDVAPLTDGRFLVVFNDSPSLSDVDIAGQYVLPTGNLTGPTLAEGSNPDQIGFFTSVQEVPAVAPRAGGAAIVVWEDLEFGTNTDVELTVLNSAGNEVTAGTEMNAITGTTGAAFPQVNPDVATLTDGRSLIVWERVLSGTDEDIHARILNAAGTAFTTSDRIDVNNNTDLQLNPAVAAGSSNTALVVYLDNTGTITNSMNVGGSFFDGTSFSTPFTIADHAERLETPDVAGLADGRFVVVYSDDVDVWGRIYDPVTPAGAFVSDAFEIDAPAGVAFEPAVYGTLDGGFVVAWFQLGAGAGYDIHARRFDARGLPFGDEFTVNNFTDTAQLSPSVAVNGSNVLFTWDDNGSRVGGDVDPVGIRGRAFAATAFDYDSARYGDFSNDGRADILFQNDNPAASALIWQTNSAGAFVNSTALGPVPSGYRIDGTGNFNSTSGDDILLRSPTSVAVWVMNGTTPQSVTPLGGTSPQWLNSGIGDFTGDGQSDLLFRNVNSGEIATWGVANNALSTTPKVLGSTSAQYHIAAVDDFTGDHQSDILFRHDNGDVAIWRIANNALAGVPAVVGSTSTSYHVVGDGDFDGNGANDILFRNDNGNLAIWLLNSQGQLLGAPAAIGTAGLQFHVDGTGDLNGDGRSDIVFRDAGGTLVEWLMNGTSFAAPPSVLGNTAVDFAIAAHHFDLV